MARGKNSRSQIQGMGYIFIVCTYSIAGRAIIIRVGF